MPLAITSPARCRLAAASNRTGSVCEALTTLLTTGAGTPVAQIAQVQRVNPVGRRAVLQGVGDDIYRLVREIDHGSRGNADGLAVVEAAARQQRARHRRAEIDAQQLFAGGRIERVDAVHLGDDVDYVGNAAAAVDRLVADHQRLGIDLVVEVDRAQQTERLAGNFLGRQLGLGAVPAGTEGVAVISGDVGAGDRGKRQHRGQQPGHGASGAGGGFSRSPGTPSSLALVHRHSQHRTHMDMATRNARPASPVRPKM